MVCPEGSAYPLPGSTISRKQPGRVLARQLLWEQCTRLWSPRALVRVDPDNQHRYTGTARIGASPPAIPWALYLADRVGEFRLLAFDFDAGRHGAPAALSDADRLAGVLDELAVPFLRVRSGDAGGQHIWVRLSGGAPAAQVAEMARRLRAFYATLDTGALSNPATGCVRAPGSPHRNGGHARPHLDGAALTAALDAMHKGAPPQVVEWLSARHPALPTTNTAHDPTPVRAIRVVGAGTTLKLACPRRPVPDRARAILSSPPDEGVDRSAVAHSVLLSLARAGHGFDDALEAVRTAPGLVRLREDLARCGPGEVERQWTRAVESAARYPQVATHDPAAAPNSDTESVLQSMEKAIAADTARWAGQGGPSDLRILCALIVLARQARTTRLDIDCRRLAQLAAVAASTVSRRLRVLARDGWVSLVKAGEGTRASCWQLHAPSNNDSVVIGATQGEPAPRSLAPDLLLAHNTHDLWSQPLGLGGHAARTHWHLLAGISSIAALSAATGYSPRTVAVHLRQLVTVRLLDGRGRPARDLAAALDTAAQTLGCAGHGEARRRRHTVDRQLHGWWLEELQWRRRSGKKKGPTRAHTEPTALALPVDVPLRSRYGRFPARENGRADYRAARARVLTRLRNEGVLAAAA